MASRSIDLISKKNKLHVQHTFFSNQQNKKKNKFARAARFLSFFALFCTTTTLFCRTKRPNFLATHYFYGGIVVCAYPIFCLLCSCSLLFFTAAHFHFAGRQHFSLSHSRFEFLCNSSLLCSITRSSTFSQITSKKTRLRCCFFFLKVRAAMRFLSK